MKLRVKRLVPDAVLPVRADAGAAGYDLSACLRTPEGSITKIYLKLGERAMIPTGLSVTVSEGTYGRIAPRSALAVELGLDVLAGVVDRSDMGEVNVILDNLGHPPTRPRNGDRIAQLVLERIEFLEVEEVDRVETTDRGASGFRSTGVERV